LLIRPIIQQVAETILEGFATPEICERPRSFSIEPAPQGSASFA
jgi:hypothetical protein